MPVIPPVASPLPIPNRWARPLTSGDPLKWFAVGGRDFMIQRAMSFVSGVIFFFISAIFVGPLVGRGRDYFLFPAFAGFRVIGPILPMGLYKKPRRIEAGQPLKWSN